MNLARQAIFFDRDGVLNQAIIRDSKPYPPASLDQLVIAEEVLPALQRLKAHGYLLIGATNQPDVARGATERSVVEAINAKLMRELPLDEIKVCYHDDRDGCDCRKPLPGLLQQAAKEYGIKLADSVMIGDRWKDITAGQQAGCKTIWINNDYAEPAPVQPNFIASSLKQAAEWIELNIIVRRKKWTT